MEVLELLKLAAPLLAVGGAWGGAKVALNGTRDRVRKMETDFQAHELKDQVRQIEIIDRLARIETKLESR